MKCFKILKIVLITSCVLLVVEAAIAQKVFTHQTSSDNITNHMTTLDHAAVNGQADVLLFVTQNYGIYNPHQIGVWKSNGKWLIYHEDKTEMPEHTSFNVLAAKPSDSVFMHQATASNIVKNWTVIDHSACNGNPDAVLLVTQNWKGTYNPKPIGVWYTQGKWAIFNQDKSSMKDVNFNVMVLNKGKNSSCANAKTSVHVVESDRKNAYGAYLSGLGIKDKNRTMFVSQNFISNGQYNNHVPAVWYTGEEWCVFNQNKKELTNGAMFNIVSFPKKAIDDDVVVNKGPTAVTNPVKTNGMNVTYVAYPLKDGKIGKYVQISDKKWTEFNGKIEYYFSEYARDEWSVYLMDKKRDVYIQLDLYTKEIYYGVKNLDRKKKLYKVKHVSNKTTGYMVSQVDYISHKSRQGKFYQTKGKNWQEQNVDKINYNFVETGRDEWSVYLEDKSRSMMVQLDLYTDEVKMGSGKKQVVAYAISNVK